MIKYPVHLVGFLLLAAFALTACGRTVAPAQVPTSPPPEAAVAPVPGTPPRALSEPTTAPGAFDFLKPADDQPGVTASSLAGDKGTLAVIVDNEWVFIKNGGKVNLEQGLSVELFLDPYPPTKLRAWLDLYLTRDGEPVTDAEAGITYDMLGMFHGPFDFAAENLGGGHYLFTIDYIMFGAWEHQMVVYMPEDYYELLVGVIAFPTALP